jgi:hypothetical protein
MKKDTFILFPFIGSIVLSFIYYFLILNSFINFLNIKEFVSFGFTLSLFILFIEIFIDYIFNFKNDKNLIKQIVE